MWIYVSRVWVPMEARKGIGFFGAEVIGCCELLGRFWGLNSAPLKEQESPLATEPYFQFLRVFPPKFLIIQISVYISVQELSLLYSHHSSSKQKQQKLPCLIHMVNEWLKMIIIIRSPFGYYLIMVSYVEYRFLSHLPKKINKRTDE